MPTQLAGTEPCHQPKTRQHFSTWPNLRHFNQGLNMHMTGDPSWGDGESPSSTRGQQQSSPHEQAGWLGGGTPVEDLPELLRI